MNRSSKVPESESRSHPEHKCSPEHRFLFHPATGCGSYNQYHVQYSEQRTETNGTDEAWCAFRTPPLGYPSHQKKQKTISFLLDRQTFHYHIDSEIVPLSS